MKDKGKTQQQPAWKSKQSNFSSNTHTSASVGSFGHYCLGWLVMLITTNYAHAAIAGVLLSPFSFLLSPSS